MFHHATLVAEVREIEPEDGWARYERTGRACLACSCGTVTGFVDKAEALRAADDHPGSACASARLAAAEPLKVDVRLVGVGDSFKSFVRQMLRRDR
ncbi:hypothetical protein FHS35_009122 [Streptomyces umbrinus]|uniref:hypothetical protein n=1 Tax=Streptomyces umbrinus TaxID=67370 RepID=UPI00167D41DE|nr:hypothetical protein [Streptomyces umbrinus]MCR3732204.1 hypothetical protein [Streptomyces umbrinus]GHH68506.1 hypothetical protein GCM10018775_93070 [Streptomyces umbrinus]